MAKPSGEKPYRVFLDANVLIAGSSFPRWAYEVLSHALKGGFQVILSPFVIEQARKHLKKDFPTSAQARFEKFLYDVHYKEVPDPTPKEVLENKDLVRHLDDIPLALSVIKAKVDYLVTEDKDFTTKDKTTEKLRRFVQPMLCGTFLKEVIGWTSEDLEEARHRKWLDIESNN